MEIAVIGAGYVGLTAAACLADLGNQVVCVESDPGRFDLLLAGQPPFYEPGLADIMAKALAAGRLSFTRDIKDAVTGSRAVFLAVGTPSGQGGAVDLSQLRKATVEIARAMDGPKIIVNKSTAPPGTCEEISRIIAENYSGDFTIVANPEFLREGSAVEDFLHPDRVVLGVKEARDAADIAALYEPLGCPVMTTSWATAEMIKYAANAYLATSISFINGISVVCESVGADVADVSRGLKLDRRIGEFASLNAGIGFGGSCLPKDVAALSAIAGREASLSLLLDAVREINQIQRQFVVAKIREETGNLRGAVIALWGLAFKSNSGDIRESPALEIAKALLAEGAIVRAHDALAGRSARDVLPEETVFDDPLAAVRGADALVLLTGWPEYADIDMAEVKKLMRQPVLIDGRNFFEPGKITKLGFAYSGIGRGRVVS